MSRQIAQVFYDLLSEKKNPLLSPVSLEMALGMLTNGAANVSLDELEDFLENDASTINNLYKDFLDNMMVDAPKEFKLLVSNSIWVNEDLTLKPSFVETLQKFYQASYHNAKFPSNQTNLEMEKWVSDQTQGLIKPTLSSEGPLVLLNTLYYKDRWMHPFSSDQNTTEDFITEDDKHIPTTFMHKKIDFHQYTKTDVYLSTSLYYDSEYRMQFILPHEGFTLQRILEEYELNFLFEPDTTPSAVKVSLPKFKFQNKLELKKNLESIGMKSIFSSTDADFPYLSDEDLYIEDIVQEAGISVDESGTEAAAYTKIDIARMAAPIGEPLEFKLNRPFLYGILSKDNYLLFVGAYQQPEKEEAI